MTERMTDRRLDHGWLREDGTYICDGCAVQEPHEHRCHEDGEGMRCDCPECARCPSTYNGYPCIEPRGHEGQHRRAMRDGTTPAPLSWSQEADDAAPDPLRAAARRVVEAHRSVITGATPDHPEWCADDGEAYARRFSEWHAAAHELAAVLEGQHEPLHDPHCRCGCNESDYQRGRRDMAEWFYREGARSRIDQTVEQIMALGDPDPNLPWNDATYEQLVRAAAVVRGASTEDEDGHG